MPPSLFASQQDFDQAFQGVDYLLIDYQIPPTERMLTLGILPVAWGFVE